jgi:hypothetical protein
MLKLKNDQHGSMICELYDGRVSQERKRCEGWKGVKYDRKKLAMIKQIGEEG